MTQRPTSDSQSFNDAVPEPDDASTSSERMRAAQFANLLDDNAKAAASPALEISVRQTLETAVALQASAGHSSLSNQQANDMVSAVLSSVIAQPKAVDDVSAMKLRRQQKNRTITPWLVAASSAVVAAAAVVFMMIRPTPSQTNRTLPLAWQSRPSDAVVGVIDRQHSGDAIARIDAIYQDRLDGYRSALYAKAGVAQ
jgi:hypothetical protein